jgi:large subunit ribosomal protein L9
MQVILFENVDRLGMKGDVVNVADGYYRNFLGPRGVALEASDANLKRLESKRRKLKGEADRQRQEADGFSRQLAAARVHFIRKSPDGEKLFGSVHDHEIHEQLTAQGFNLERRQIVLREPLKTCGVHTVKIRLVGHLEAHVKVVIEPEAQPELKAAAEAAPQPQDPSPAEPGAESSESAGEKPSVF